MMGASLPPVRTQVGADVTGFTGGINQAAASLGGFKGGLAAATVGLAAFAGIKGLKGALDAAVKFERQVAELEKLLGPQFAAPAAEAVSDLGNRIAASRDQLFGAAEAAARLGVRGTENIEAFTETMGKVGLVTDLAAEQASTSMARLAKISRTPIPSISNLASTINEASNTMAVSFSEVLDASLRAAPGLASLGAQAPAIVALSASLGEVSASSERAGTRLNRLGSLLQDVDREPALAGALGLTVAQFRALRRESPAEAIIQLAEVMRDGGDRARELASELDETSLKVLRSLAQNADDARGRIEQMSRAFEENTSLQDEYSRFADTAAARTQVLENRMEDLQVEIGERLLPTFVATLEKANFLLGALNRLGEAGGGEAVTGLEAIDRALNDVVQSSGLTSDQVASTEDAIRQAAGRFEDAGARAGFLTESLRLIRTNVVRTPADLERLRQSLGTVFRSFQKIEEGSSTAADGIRRLREETSRAAGQQGRTIGTEQAVQQARLRLLEEELGVFGLQLQREREKLRLLRQEGAERSAILDQARRVAELERDQTEAIRSRDVTVHGAGRFRETPQERAERQLAEGGLPSGELAGPGEKREVPEVALEGTDEFGRLLKSAAIPAIDEFAGQLGIGTGMVASFLDSLLTSFGEQFGGKGGAMGFLGDIAGAFAGGFQSGGRIPAGRFGVVHPGETIMTGPANVKPAGAGGTTRHENNFQISIEATDAQSFEKMLREKGGPAMAEMFLGMAGSSEGFSRGMLTGSGG